MTNPVLVELLRSSYVESIHRGTFVAVDEAGTVMLSSGDFQKPVFPRSAIKAMQALYLLESGGADAYGFGDQEIALASSSHSGEPEHERLVLSMLERSGLSEDNLECGAHWSTQIKPLIEQVRSKKHPSPCLNNCSGKHAGFLCAGHHAGEKTEGYIDRDHIIQRQIAAYVEMLTGAKMADAICGIDGCSIPTYALTLDKMALGFAKMATGAGLSASIANHSKRIIKACMNEPFFVAGTNRACTKIMEIGQGRIFAKTGAEGVYGAALPELGIGIALKIDDGGTRAAEAAIAAILAKLLGSADPASVDLMKFATRDITNWNKIKVGAFQVAPDISPDLN